MIDMLNNNLSTLNKRLAQFSGLGRDTAPTETRAAPRLAAPALAEREAPREEKATVRGLQALLQARNALPKEPANKPPVRFKVEEAPNPEQGNGQARPGAAPAKPRRELLPEETDQILASLIMDAKIERLEAMVTLLEALRASMVTEESQGAAPPGALTVSGWITLFHRWDFILQRTRQRLVFFAHDFLKHTLSRDDVAGTPLLDPLQELSEMMAKRLEVEVS